MDRPILTHRRVFFTGSILFILVYYRIQLRIKSWYPLERKQDCQNLQLDRTCLEQH